MTQQMSHGSRSLSQILRFLPDTEDLTLGAVMDRLGSRAHGTAILLLGLPDVIPLPVPSVGAILGLPLALISAHLALFGEAAPLPPMLRRIGMPARLVAVLRSDVANALDRLERMSRPRWEPVAGRERAVGLVCLYLSLLLLLPLPFFNTPPSLCLVLLAWGILQRDGLFVIAGLAGTVALSVALALGAVTLGNLLG